MPVQCEKSGESRSWLPMLCNCLSDAQGAWGYVRRRATPAAIFAVTVCAPPSKAQTGSCACARKKMEQLMREKVRLGTNK